MESSPAIARALSNLQSTNSSLFLLLSISLASLFLVLLTLKSINGGEGKNLPPGNLGFPVIGETLQFLSAYKSNRGKDWVKERVEKYGPVFKTSLMGCPTVILTGQAGNRFLFHNDGHTITNTQPKHLARIFGENGIGMLSGEEHRRIRGAIMGFMKPEALQSFVGRIDSVVRQHFAEFWEGKESITVMPLMNKLTFQVACDLFFSLSNRGEMDELGMEFETAVKGVWSIPLDLPGTAYRRAFHARCLVKKQISLVVEKRRREIQGGTEFATQDFMTCLIAMKDENGKELSEGEIIDNVITVMIAGHDTTASLLTHIVRVMALHPQVYQNVLQEQTTVLEGKQSDEPLKWEDLRNMKYTWKVAQEALRLFPPIFGGFRKTIEDVEYQGCTIPKGWQLFWETSSTHWNDEYFKEPHLFDPSHFDSQASRFVFTPFGGGPRICPGYNFAKIETMIFVHYLVTKWKWSMKNPDERIISDPAPIPMMGLPINIYSKVK